MGTVTLDAIGCQLYDNHEKHQTKEPNSSYCVLAFASTLLPTMDRFDFGSRVYILLLMIFISNMIIIKKDMKLLMIFIFEMRILIGKR